MRSLLLPLFFLTLLTAAHASPINALDQLTLPNNFELCGQLEPDAGSSSQELELAVSGSVFGSLTGFIDFSAIDGLLRFLDEHVMSTMQDARRLSLVGALEPPSGDSGV